MAVRFEAEALAIANRVDDLLTALPVDAVPVARQELQAARDALRKAAEAFADASEARSK